MRPARQTGALAHARHIAPLLSAALALGFASGGACTITPGQALTCPVAIAAMTTGQVTANGMTMTFTNIDRADADAHSDGKIGLFSTGSNCRIDMVETIVAVADSSNGRRANCTDAPDGKRRKTLVEV